EERPETAQPYPLDLPMGPERTGVAVVSRYPSVRAGLRVLLESEPDQRVVAEAASLELLRDAPFGERAAVGVVDLAAADAGIELGDEAGGPGLVLLGADAGTLRELSHLLPRPLGFLPRDVGGAELIAAVRTVRAGLLALDAAIAAELLSADPV